MQKSGKLLTTLFASASLLMCLSATPVHASASHELPKAVTKVASAKNYRIYRDINSNGPSHVMGQTKDFKYAHLESKEYAKTKKGTYWLLIINGRSTGWVNQDFFIRNKISLAKSVNLVHNDAGEFETKDAINYVADKTGTMINPSHVKTSQKTVKENKGGDHEVEYSYGTASAKLNIHVRNDEDEGLTSADADPISAKNAESTWKGSSKSSSYNWNAEHHYQPEIKKNVYTSDSSNPMTLTTRLYQPRFLSLDYGENDEISQVGVTPEGIAVKNGDLTVSLFADPHELGGHLVSYNLNNLTSPYDAQNLTSMPWREFVDYSRNIKVSPYLKLGHGQSVSDSGKYIYVLANNNKMKNSSQSDEILQISKKDLSLHRIWSVKVFNGDSSFPRYFHNMSIVNDHTMYGLFHNGSKGTYEYWKLEREGDRWNAIEIGATDSNLVKDAPVQGFAYDQEKDEFYVGFNDYIFRVASNGNILDMQHFDTKRELEGLSVDNGQLYTELTQRAELLKASFGNSIESTETVDSMGEAVNK